MNDQVTSQDNPPTLFGGPHWLLSHARGFSRFFSALPDLVPPGAILQIEGNPYPDVEASLQKWMKKPSRKTGWLFRTLARYEVPINAENMTMLVSMAEHHAEPEVADHFVVLSGAEQLLHWFDAPSDPIYVAGCVEEAPVTRFADRLGAQVKKEAGSTSA